MWNACKLLLDWLRVIYFHPVKNSSIIDGNEANYYLITRFENRMTTAEEWRGHVSQAGALGFLEGRRREVEERYIKGER